MLPTAPMIARGVLILACAATSAVAQTATNTAPASGRIEGVVTRKDSGTPIGGVSVRISGTGIGTSTSNDGHFSLSRVPLGPQTIELRWIGYAPESRSLTIGAGTTQRADISLSAVALRLADVFVEAASKAPERIVSAPAAITVIPSYQAASLASRSDASENRRR